MDRCLFSAPSDFLGSVLHTTPFEVIEREVWTLEDVQSDPAVTAWITNTGWQFRLGARELDLFPKLRVVVTPSTGADHIDVQAIRARGIQFFSLLDDRLGLESISASAEFAFLLLLASLRRLPQSLATAGAGRWRLDDETSLRGSELRGRSIGLVGLGRIGRRLARYCNTFDCKVFWFDPHVKRGPGTKVDSLQQLFECCHSVVTSCTLNAGTRDLIGADLLSRLPVGGTLVNISRGEVLREQEISELLLQRADLVVAVDVLVGETEGLQFASPLLPLVRPGQVIVTPHIAGCTVESQTQAARVALGLVARALGYTYPVE